MTNTQLAGLHHLSAISSDAQNTIDFYVGILGLSLLKQTVNFDDPRSYHLYFGDPEHQIGTMTFFVWPGAHHGQIGRGGTSRVSIPILSDGELGYWETWLASNAITTSKASLASGSEVLRIEDPDGLQLELIHRKKSSEGDQTATRFNNVVFASSEVPRLGPIDQVSVIVSDLERSRSFYAGALGLVVGTQAIDQSALSHVHSSIHVDEIQAKTPSIVLIEADEKIPPFRLGAGLTHHFALQATSEADLFAWRDYLNETGVHTTDVKDRRYFQSIYFRDPDGHVVEIATTGPSFTVDETISELGQQLALPPWLEDHRPEIVRGLPPLNSRPARTGFLE